MNDIYDELNDKSLSDKDAPSGFIPSKWETIDPDQIEAQAMTTSKWDLLENSTEDNSLDSSQNEVQDSNDATDSRLVCGCAER